MKTIVIGDIHGRSIWKDIVNQDYDQVVFLGDYFDTHEDISPSEQINNFNQIMHFARKNPKKVVLLVGNHDFHYMPEAKERYSGYDAEHADIIGQMLIAANLQGLLRLVHPVGRYLMSHAGVTLTWCMNVVGSELYEISHPHAKEDLIRCMNDVFKHTPEKLRFSYQDQSGFGEHPSQGPLWVRPNTLLEDAVQGFIHVVGHTMHEGIKEYPDQAIFMDALGSREYLVIEDNNHLIKKI